MPGCHIECFHRLDNSEVTWLTVRKYVFSEGFALMILWGYSTILDSSPVGFMGEVEILEKVEKAEKISRKPPMYSLVSESFSLIQMYLLLMEEMW